MKYAQQYDWYQSQSAGELQINGTRYVYNTPEQLSGITMTAQLVKVRQGSGEISNGTDPQPLYLAVFDNGNWIPYAQGAVVTSTFAETLTTADYVYQETFNNEPLVDGQGPRVLDGSIGFCADDVSGSGLGWLSTYRVDMTFSKSGDSDSQSLYLLLEGF